MDAPSWRPVKAKSVAGCLPNRFQLLAVACSSEKSLDLSTGYVNHGQRRGDLTVFLTISIAKNPTE
jgi:hypothetical protein